MKGKQTNHQNRDQSRGYALPVTGQVFCMWRVHYTRESVTWHVQGHINNKSRRSTGY